VLTASCLLGCNSSTILPTAVGPAQLLAALTAASRDAVLAVRLPAVASLATFCQMLSSSAANDPVVLAAAQHVFPACLQLAVAAAIADNDKLRPCGLQALGSLAALADALPPTAVAQQAPWLEAAVAAVSGCLAAKSVRVQWAACEAAGALLACGAAQVQQHSAALLQHLLVLLQECPNFRSRTLAASALLRLRSWAALGGSGSRAVQLLDDVAVLLFQGALGGTVPAGKVDCLCLRCMWLHSHLWLMCLHACCCPAGKANDFCVPAPPAAAATQRSEGQMAPRHEPGELGSKAQLEATLVAVVLHLLALLVLVEDVPTGGSTQQPQLSILVQQALRELLPPVEVAVDEMAAGAAEAVYFDLSQASPQLAASAAEGLALL